MHSPLGELQLPRCNQAAALIGVDWGTSNLRVMQIGSDGAIFGIRTDRRGAVQLAAEVFRDVLREVAGDWIDETGKVIVCGMAGARGKWRETGYRNCPSGLADLKPVPLGGEDAAISIIPGVALTRNAILTDVMRGEETQVFGLPEAMLAGTVVTPGTHSKWIRVEGGQICDFRTFMTGELFASVRSGTVLGEEMGEPGDDHAAFEEGVQQGLTDQALTAVLFSVRTKRLSGLLAASATADYLSGLLIGAEILAQDQDRNRQITLVGPPALNARYEKALAMAGYAEVQAVDANTATARGLLRIHEAHGA